MSAVEISTIDEDYDSEKSSTSETQDTKQPPLVFPSDDEKTETSKNETALEILQKNSNASTMDINTEVKLDKFFSLRKSLNALILTSAFKLPRALMYTHS